jgi:hypothetical protein
MLQQQLKMKEKTITDYTINETFCPITKNNICSKRCKWFIDNEHMCVIMCNNIRLSNIEKQLNKINDLFKSENINEII